MIDFKFLNGTDRDPSKLAFLIIDSDDDDNSMDKEPSKPTQISPQSITLQDSLEEISLDISSPRTSYNNDIQMPTSRKRVQTSKALNDRSKTPPSANIEDPFSILEDDGKDNDNSPLSFLSLDGDEVIPVLPDDDTSNREEKTNSIFGRHFEEDDDILEELPSTTAFFDDLLLKKPATPIVELDDDDDEHDAIEIDSLLSPPETRKPSSIDRKGKRRAYEYDFDTIVDTPRSNRRRLDEDVFDDAVPMTAAERKEKEKEERKRQRELAAEEKKRKKAEALEEKQRQKEQKQV